MGGIGETFHYCLDCLLAASSRLLELPLFVLMAGIGTVAWGSAFLLARRTGSAAHPGSVRVLRWVPNGLLLLAIGIVVDHRIAAFQGQVEQLRLRNQDSIAAMLEAGPGQVVRRRSYLFELKDAEQALSARFGKISLRPCICNEAMDVVDFHVDDPLVEAFLAVVDLGHPDLEIELGVGLEHKTLTSAFARETDCIVAINGEAGNSPGPDSGLGPWRGKLVYRGETILCEAREHPRPFLAFDRSNHATFVSSAFADRADPSDRYNVIWGREDAIVGGEVQTAEYRHSQPRTAMGIDREGERLYLLVVDGRQPEHSWGFSRAQVGWFLQAFGASDAMLCDEGGSSCMYVKQFGGIVNVPSDDQGRERPTYTHFGVSLRTNEPRDELQAAQLRDGGRGQ
jgi:hypothetical protein